MSLVLGFSAIAQQRVIKDDARKGVASIHKTLAGKEMTPETSNYVPQVAKSVVVNRDSELEEAGTMWTYYDLQSNQYVANRMYQLPNGSVAVAATMSHEDNQTASDRGTGYNFFDGNDWLDEPDERVEPFKTGWPSIAQWKDGGEILLAHGNNHMQCFVRETAGEGEWIYKGALPDYPEGYAYTSEYPTWPRVVTCGDNHDIIVAVAVLQHSISSDETDLQSVMWRSEDAENWTISYGPLEDVGWNHNQFSADDYCMAAYGHTVALLYSGCLTNSTWLFKSTDDGLTWESTRVWENPYEGREFDEEPAWGMEDTLYMPMNGTVVVDPKGVVHVALNTFEMEHTLENEPGYYSYFYGRGVDGILYWNDTEEAPIQSKDGNPHHAARLWWPVPGEPGYTHMEYDSVRWAGYLPLFEGYDWDSDKYYFSNTEYTSKFYGASGHPALSCDPNGNLALAFSTPDVSREDTDISKYYRSIFVSYRNVDEGYWRPVESYLTDPELNIEHMVTEGVFTNAVSNTINPGEFWFSYQDDMSIGFYWGSNASQEEATENVIQVVKIIADPAFVSVPENYDAQEAVYNIYPNPASEYVVISSAMESDATITFHNLVGQVVKQFNKHLGLGENTISIDLKSGVYFCTVNANGFNKTVKVVVK